ncbi:uncharacterized protein cfap92 [Pundamilia nyererei]|uniref:Uncharacterized protein cfap92 n=1 Tax=Pundamilia nyererei TaxID=303518 RepID=A0A9Y6J7V8_9CICH|nr:PREDICTED: uncharacterized protein KIAA1257 homolog [Pundamilia nyererei]
MSEKSVCNPTCDDENISEKEQEEVLVFETELLSSTDSYEDIKVQTDDSAYYVTWTVYIALAVPQGEVSAPEDSEKAMKTKNVSVYKAQSCYHIEYKLLPGDTETVKVDILVFGPAAKIYREDECKILRTWLEGDQIWVGWAQKFNIGLNRDVLISLLPHKIRLQIWNTKDKLCSQARYERVRAFKLSQELSEDETECGCIETMVNKLRSLCENKTHTSKRQRSNFCVDLSPDVGPETGFEKTTSVYHDLDAIRDSGTASFEISPVCLLAGENSLTENTPVCSSGVFEIIFNISLDEPLMSDQLKAELNPLVITILSATSLPSSSVPFHILQEKCMPVYCQYKFHNLNEHRTNYHKQDTNIYFRDVNVILTGLMSRKELYEFLSGPPLEIEVHDRDQKSEALKTQTLGTASEHDIQFGGSVLQQKSSAINPHGIAKLNLSELLLGKKSLKVCLPVKCSPLLLDRERSPHKRKMSEKPMPQGHYYAANSQLKVKVEITCPFSVQNDSCDEDSCKGPFGRIVYLFGYSNSSAMTKLRSEILQINAAAFHLGSRSVENIETALSNYQMNFEHSETKDLDFVSGFHVIDKKTHIFVLEGLKQKTVKRLWEAIPMKLRGSEEEQVTVLYNSNLVFFRRIYDSLDMSLSPIHLSQSLETIMKKSQIYVRGTIPQPCFQALSRLSQLCQVKQLKEVVEYNLFPSADMILSLSSVFGLYAEKREQKVRANTEGSIPTLPIRMKRHGPISTHNTEYITWKQNRPLQQLKDFVQENIKKVQEQREQLQKPEAAVLWIDMAAGRTAHNYSIQTFNSNERARELLCKEMAKVPGRRFTYSQRYNSATVDPGDISWKTNARSSSTSTFWNISTSKSKVHPNHPDEARVEELRKPWRENILHANTLKPTLSRDTWPWTQHSEDFELYRKPPRFFSTSPVTIYLAGDRLQQEQLQAARAQYSRWKKQLLPDGSNVNSADNSPVQQFKCHMKGNLERTQDILKDLPKKYSLRKPGMILKPFPQLSVMNAADNKAEERERVPLAPGPCVACSLGRNAFPRHNSQYSKYHYNGFCEQHSFLYKRTALPLTDRERSIFRFQK